LISSLLVLLVAVCYHNTLPCGFVFDDRAAVVENKDLRPETPVSNLIWNDFWGTPMHQVCFNRAMHFSAVLRSHVVCLSVCPSVCDVVGSGPCTQVANLGN